MGWHLLHGSHHCLSSMGCQMKVILEEKDLLPLIQRLLLERYPEFDKVHLEFVMRRKWLSTRAALTVECELIPERQLDLGQIK